MPFTFYHAAKTQNKYSERPALLFPASSERKVPDTACHPISSKNYIFPFAPENPISQNNWQKPFSVLSPETAWAPETFRPLLCSSTSSSSQHPSPVPIPWPAGPAIKPDTTESCTSLQQTTDVCEGKKEVSYTHVLKDHLNCARSISRSLQVSSSTVYLNYFKRKANKPISTLTLFYKKI